MQPTLYRIRDELTLEVLRDHIQDPVTADYHLELLSAEHPHLWLEIQAYNPAD